MNYYLYDENNYFTGIGEAEPGDIPGSYYFPNNSTTTEVPELEIGEKAKWNNTEWEVIPAPTIDEIRELKLAEINKAKWDAIDNGEVEYEGLHFHTDSSSQSLLGNNIQIFQTLSKLPVVWKAKDGYLPITSVDQLIAIGALIAQYVEAQFGREYELVALINNSETSFEDIVNITW
jgi:hypothetical protein